LSPEKEPLKNKKVAGAKVPLNEQNPEQVEKKKTQGAKGIFWKKTENWRNK
jgi:hypothetical protein